MSYCPLCGSERSELLWRFHENPWLPGVVKRCGGCGVRYKVPDGGHEAVDGLYRRSELASHDYWNNEEVATSAFEGILARLVDELGSCKGQLLDVGSGPGTFGALAQAAGFEVTAVEANSELADRARSTGVEVIEGSMPGALDGSHKRFDAITLLDVIEHVLDPIALLRSCRALLRSGGVVVVYTPNHSGPIVRAALLAERCSRGRAIGPVREIFDGPHVVFFDRCTLGSSLAASGFSIRSVSFTAYDPGRSQQATGAGAAALRALERIAPWTGGRFRMTAIATTSDQDG